MLLLKTFLSEEMGQVFSGEKEALGFDVWSGQDTVEHEMCYPVCHFKYLDWIKIMNVYNICKVILIYLQRY